jgi:hypothetical protein
MTWMQISECLPAWLSAQIAKEGAEDFSPAQVKGGTNIKQRKNPLFATQPAETATSLGKAKGELAHKQAHVRRAGSPLILVWNNESDGPAWVGGGRAPGRLRSKPGRERAREYLKLVHAVDLSNTGVSMRSRNS